MTDEIFWEVRTTGIKCFDPECQGDVIITMYNTEFKNYDKRCTEENRWVGHCNACSTVWMYRFGGGKVFKL